jgi:hypothetical protein
MAARLAAYAQLKGPRACNDKREIHHDDAELFLHFDGWSNARH